MFIDLTLSQELIKDAVTWAHSQDNPHIAMGHIGTHLDTYLKTAISLDYFKTHGVLFDVANKAEVLLKDIDLSRINQRDFVLFRTARVEQYAYGTKEYFDNHPCLSHELIDALIEKKVCFIGVDCPGIRQGEEHTIVDKKCEDHGVYVIENLHNLHILQDSLKNNIVLEQNLDSTNSQSFVPSYRAFNVFTAWFDDITRTGLPCKVIAELLQS